MAKKQGKKLTVAGFEKFILGIPKKVKSPVHIGISGGVFCFTEKLYSKQWAPGFFAIWQVGSKARTNGLERWQRICIERVLDAYYRDD